MNTVLRVVIRGLESPDPDILRALNDVFDRVDIGHGETDIQRNGHTTIVVACGASAEADAHSMLASPEAFTFVAVALPDDTIPSVRLRTELAKKGCLMVFLQSGLSNRETVMALRDAAVACMARSAPFRQFQRMVEHARDVITVLDPHGTIMYQSPSVKDALGFEPRDMTGRNFTEFVHPDDVAALISILSQYGHVDGASQSARYRFRNASDDWLDLESHAIAKQREDGHMEIIVTSRDVTHVSQAVRHLEERERQLSEAQRIAHLGSWRLLPNDDHMEWSSELFRIFGFDPDSEVTRNRMLEAVHDQDRSSLRATMQSLKDSGTAVSDSFRIMRTDGEVRHVRLLAEMTAGSEEVVGIVHDVTEAERSRAAFEISERRFRELFMLSPDAIALVDDSGLVFDANEAACALFNQPHSEVTRHPLLHFIVPEDRSKVADMVHDTPKNPSVSEIPVRVQTGEQDGHPVSLHVNVIQENDRTIRLIYMRDEKSRIENEERLRELSRHQGDMLERERMRISREVHDVLGQELTALRLEMSWIRKHLDDDGVLERIEATEERARMAVETARRIAHELRPGILDDFGLAAAISWQAKQFERRTGITIHFVSSGVIQPPEDLSTAIFRIFQELLTNVARHAQASSVESTLSRTGQNLILTVADDGRGMHIGDATMGNSLGLMGIRERILPWSGRLELDSIPGKGTSISVIIPVETHEAPGH